MTRFETLSANLPSLYRPADDDPEGEALKLRSGDVLTINGVAPEEGTVAESGLSLVVTMPLDTKIETIELRPSSAAGNTLLLEFYLLSGDLFQSRPLVVAQVQDATVEVRSTFVAQVFGLRLKRPGLLTRLLRTVANVAEQASLDETIVLQSHWFKYADSALYHPYAVRSRELADEPTPLASDPSLDLFPYIHDLARLSALMALPPWQEPLELRERVEAYRERIRKIVALYRNGLGTVDAIRAMTEAQLPPRVIVPEGEETDQERSNRLENEEHPFWIEEFAPLIGQSVAAQATTAGAPEGIVGPMMRWEVKRELGFVPVSPTIYITGMTPEAGEIDATENPVIESFFGDAGADATGYAGVGIAWQGTVPPDQTLRLRPIGLSYLGTENGTLLAESEPDADPTASSNWGSIPDSPTSRVTALAQSADGMIWLGSDDEGSPNLWRYDGQTWTDVLAGDPPNLGGVNTLVPDKNRLLIGAGNGLFSYSWYDETPAMTELYGSEAVNAIFKASDGQIWWGTPTGTRLLAPDNTTAPTALNGIAVNAIAEGDGGILVFGTDLGVLMYQQGFDVWYWYSGESGSDQDDDWLLWDPGSPLPTDDMIYMSRVLSLRYGPDTSLWIGTENGFARYFARGDGKGFLTYNTVLEAYPDLCDIGVHEIQIDIRGLVWLFTERGLFRYDGQNIWQYLSADDVWVKKGRADSLYGARPMPEQRGQWRFNRALGNWQRYNAVGVNWEVFSEDLRSTDDRAVTTILWASGVVADIGTLGDDFAVSQDDVSAGLQMRFKPDETRIANGGRPFIPSVPTGSSTWRYLALEGEIAPDFTSFPAWTVEGRLLPPPDEFLTPAEGRYDRTYPPPKRAYDQSVFAYNPAAIVSMSWMDNSLLTVLVRIQERLSEDLTTTEPIEPAIIDRVKAGVARVRAAGVEVRVAVGDELVEESV